MPKFDLNLAKGSSYFYNGRLSIGVYVKNKIATLIDTGIDKDTAKSVNQLIKKKGFTVGAIINTHSHADHCGGNNFFQREYKNIKIYSTKFEKHYIEDPKNEPLCFCSGAVPFIELQNKHLEAEPSVVTDTIDTYQDQVINIVGEDFKIVTLPGHTNGMIGVITPDNILYCGDAIFGEETFKKHGILFYTNIKDTFESFKKLANLKIDGCVLYHGGFVEKIPHIIEQHENKILETKEIIFDCIKAEPLSIDSLVQKVMQQCKIPNNIVQFTLTRTCVNAYIVQLQNEKCIELAMDDGLLKVLAKNEHATKSSKNQVEIVYAKRRDCLSVFGGYHLPNSDEAKINNYAVSLAYKTGCLLKGDMHIDAIILNAIQYIIDYLKYIGLAFDKDVQVKGDESIESCYSGAKLSYNSKGLGEITSTNIMAKEIASINLFADHFTITFKDEKAIDKQYLAEIERTFVKLGLQPQMVESKSKPQYRMS